MIVRRLNRPCAKWHLVKLLVIKTSVIPAKAGIQILILDPRFGFGFLRRPTSCVHAVVRGDDSFSKSYSLDSCLSPGMTAKLKCHCPLPPFFKGGEIPST